jgi:purine nucleoside phosphorylase
MEDVSHDEVLKAAAKAEPHVRKLIKELIIQF